MSSSSPAITVEGLSKRYVIGHEVRHDTLRDAISHGVGGLWSRFRRKRMEQEEFWALRDINFTVQPGEVVGIIGRNGAGKSTLLKILSRITEPTTGLIQLNGRVASLLEVGTGFHPELSGRENIFLNGAILGMSRAEIRQKFDEIVAFAEVERFLDTPVKRYSSGMYVRLAFAVAAHLEPEILIVDEVLAVGDTQFQKKCLGKMQDVSSNQGRTVLFVSHNLASIRQLCHRGLFLQNGRLRLDDESSVVLRHYQSSETPPVTNVSVPEHLTNVGSLLELATETADGRRPAALPFAEPWRIRVRYRLERPFQRCVVSIGLRKSGGSSVQTAWSLPVAQAAGDYETVFTQDRVTFEADSYIVSASLSENDQTLHRLPGLRFEIEANPSPTSDGYYPRTTGVGVVLNSTSVETRSL
ncbi:polysaccharide ABC transporter ATP-binding protein [Synoicihabitans lomoniglobus]|uniref:Polysaccharide ABC transporter ATP-binding protein n=1 Tax=Synoicihabitans lomoniglobus TaxID=2909285 RepID=A0AAF0CSN9_9BACT|nr:polysaccharide ABC transporter ATP-binding protein [Opitutaceae bacterium LMO-M01]WED67325.1 polysaccharide ABC transporter ATP-binding protein [Opitutaceae bacterium LMO-M01]